MRRVTESQHHLPHLQHTAYTVHIQIVSEPLYQDHRRSELLAEVLQYDHVVTLGVDLEEADLVDEVVVVVGLEEGKESDRLH